MVRLTVRQRIATGRLYRWILDEQNIGDFVNKSPKLSEDIFLLCEKFILGLNQLVDDSLKQPNRVMIQIR